MKKKNQSSYGQVLDIFGCNQHIDGGYSETGNNITERGSVKGLKEGTQVRAPGYSIGE